MLIIILIIIIIFLLIKNYSKIESFINFRLPNEGHWCDKNDCDYPVITIIKPNEENKKKIQIIENKPNILPKNKNFNSGCYNCIIQNDKSCMYITIDSKDSIHNISKIFIEWFDLMDDQEKQYLMNRKSFYFKDNNLYFIKKIKKKTESIEYLIKPSMITNTEDTVYGDEIIIRDDNVYVSIEFYVLLLVIFYKLSLNETKLKYNKNDKKFIKNYINQITSNFNFNKIKDNQHTFNLKDDYFEKCNIGVLDNNIPENYIHLKNKNNIKNASEMISDSINSATSKINSTIRKNQYLSKIHDKNLDIKKVIENRKQIFEKDNVFNEKCLNHSNILQHSENRYSEIKDNKYIYSCGNFFQNSKENETKFEKCDNFGNFNGLKPDGCCLIPDESSIINKIDNKYPLYKNSNGCTVTENKNSHFCNQKEFVFDKHNSMELLDSNTC
jgi:hypothetical protein